MKINGRDTFFSYHALEQFERHFTNKNGESLKNPLGTAINWLTRAEEEDIDPTVKAIRILDNNMRETRYFRFNEWRFVVAKSFIPNSKFPWTVLTIEIAFEDEHSDNDRRLYRQKMRRKSKREKYRKERKGWN